MRTKLTVWMLASVVSAGVGYAQSGAHAIPRLPDGKPNLQGVWDHPYVPDMSKDGKDQKGAGELPYTQWGADNFKHYNPADFDYTGHCLPFGLMRSINVGGYPIQIMQNDDYVALLFEQNTWFHVVPTDGRPMPKDPDPTWFGTSVGRWDGDTLVVDTTNFNDKTRFRGSSPDLHIVERFTRTGPHTLLYRFTVEDPKTWARPWTGEYTWPETQEHIYEYACHEGNYALGDILRGARLKEAEDTKKKSQQR
jgi:hypothetical protein